MGPGAALDDVLGKLSLQCLREHETEHLGWVVNKVIVHVVVYGLRTSHKLFELVFVCMS